MTAISTRLHDAALSPVDVHVSPAVNGRNRLTVAFRPLLAIPHLLLVGGPMALVAAWTWSSDREWQYRGSTGGVLGLAAVTAAILAWFAILFTGREPDGLWRLRAYYLRWRVQAMAYMALLRDEYPPFGDSAYGATLELATPVGTRDRLTTAFRLILALPHLVILWVLGLAWGVTTVIAWFAVLLTARFPVRLYRFGVGTLRWNARVEAYVLLLHDGYPPFSLH
jgi:hypothetical protein